MSARFAAIAALALLGAPLAAGERWVREDFDHVLMPERRGSGGGAPHALGARGANSSDEGADPPALLQAWGFLSEPVKALASEFVPAAWRPLLAESGWMVGKGSYGVVHVIDTAMGLTADRNIQIAIKTQRDKDNKFSALEIELGKKFDHPYVIKLWGDDTVYDRFQRTVLAMESAAKGDLKEGHKMERRVVAKAMLEMFVAMQYVHSQGYVHSDFKPEQVMLSGNGVAKLGDLGLICEDGHKGLDGTIKYRAPELIKTKVRTTSIDLWAMGLSLYELTHGGEQLPEMKDHPGGYSSKLKGLPDDKVMHRGDSTLDRLIAGLLVVDPKKRLTAAAAVPLAAAWAREEGVGEDVVQDVLEAKLDSSKRTPLPAAWGMCLAKACGNLPCRETSADPLTVECQG